MPISVHITPGISPTSDSDLLNFKFGRKVAMTSLKALSKGVFTLNSVRNDAARRKHNSQLTNQSFSNSKNDFELCDNEQGSFSSRISTPELLRHVAAVASIKVNT